MSTKVIVTQPPGFTAKVVAPGQFKVVATGITFVRGQTDGAGNWDELEGKPETFPPEAHEHDWDEVEGKPTEFPPEAHEHEISEVEGLAAALSGKADSSHTHGMGDVVGLAAALAAKADLVGGVVPTSQIPAQAVSEFLGDVASQAAMLALVGQSGDWCIRTDVNRTYFIIAEPSSSLANWRYIETPASPVTSVNSQTGVIVLGKSDIGLANADNTSDAAKPVSTAQQTALDLKANLASPTFTGTVGGITKSMVGLGSADNTTDLNKPVSVLQQAALDGKLALQTPLSNWLGIDVNMALANTWYTGATIVMPVGVWLVLGQICMSRNDAGVLAYWYRLYDGTAEISSASTTASNVSAKQISGTLFAIVVVASGTKTITIDGQTAQTTITIKATTPTIGLANATGIIAMKVG